MESKFIALFALIALANAGYIAPQVYQAAPALATAPLAYAASPVIAKVATPILATKSIDTDYDHHPQYSYAYDVQDSITGDFKSQHETRDGDIVQGSYSLLEADGTRRIVDYTADGHNGFNAIVHKEPATKVALAAPVAKITTPALTYGAPIQTIAKITSPIATYGAPTAIATPAYAPVSAAYAPSPAITYGAPSTIAKFATPLAATYTTAHAALGAPAYAPAYATPVAKIASAPVIAKISPHPYIAHVTYTSPLFSYSI